ncbi:MAG: M14 family metallopeptidase [Bacteroidales bacterium]|nr:M14 family metallopeptidase [Bacteroidales bacterium]
MKQFVFLATWFLLCTKIIAQNLVTYFEQSQYKRTPRYDSTIWFCKQLAQKCHFIHYTTIGKSHEGRDIPLLIAATRKEFTPLKAHKSGKNIVLIQACIHPGEPDGKDAILLFFRDLLTKPHLKELLNNNIILFIPILNVDGHERFSPFNRINQNGPIEMGWRTNARNLNLNRDYIKAQSLEIQHWLKFFHLWKPHFFIDCHTTDGADYQYPITYALEVYGNMDKEVTYWQKNIFLQELHKRMDTSAYPIFRYVSFRNWYDFESGLSTWVTPPSLSQGYTALVNCPGLLIESHMLKDYKTRVLGTYEIIKQSLQILSNEKEALQKFAFNVTHSDSLHVAFSLTNDSTMVDFKGFEYAIRYSNLTKGKWFEYSNIPKVHKLPLFETFIPTKTINVPQFYIVPKAWASFFKHYFDLHDIKYIETDEEQEITAKFYSFSNVKLASTSYENCQRVLNFQVQTISRKVKFQKGSLLVSTNQPNYRILVHLIEPEAPASLFTFGFFNCIFEQKEYGETYVLEPLAQKMLEDETIKKQFEDYIHKNPNATSYEILNWFYNKSKYADEWLNVYPIGKIFTEK